MTSHTLEYIPRNRVRDELKEKYIEDISTQLGWEDKDTKFFVTSGSKGMANWRYNTISLPLWLWTRRDRDEYIKFAVANELASLLSNQKHMSLPKKERKQSIVNQMEEFKKLCPKELWFYKMGKFHDLTKVRKTTRSRATRKSKPKESIFEKMLKESRGE